MSTQMQQLLYATMQYKNSAQYDKYMRNLWTGFSCTYKVFHVCVGKLFKMMGLVLFDSEL